MPWDFKWPRFRAAEVTSTFAENASESAQHGERERRCQRGWFCRPGETASGAGVNAGQNLDLARAAREDFYFAVVDLLALFGENDIDPLGKDRGGESPAICEDGGALGGLDGPFDV